MQVVTLTYEVNDLTIPLGQLMGGGLGHYLVK